jgi:hypothetical protein
MRHLAKYMHDVVNQCTETWCEAPGSTRGATENIEQCDCEPCLLEAHEHGNEASRQLAAIRYARGKGVKYP